MTVMIGGFGGFGGSGAPIELIHALLRSFAMCEAFICAYLRTPIGRFGGALSSVRADDLGAVPLKALMQRHPSVDFAAVDEVIFGCANQAGEDNRNVARMSLLLAGFPETVPGTTITASAVPAWTRSLQRRVRSSQARRSS